MSTTAFAETLSSTALLKPLFHIQPSAAATITDKIPVLNIPLLVNHVSFQLPLGSDFRTAQGQEFAVNMFITPSNGPTQIVFSVSGLPTGVSLSPGTTNVALVAGSNHKYIHFLVATDAPIVTGHAVTLHWTAYNGSVTGSLPLTVSIWSGFPMQHQQESNWCWAAVSVSMEHYYNPSSSWTQCQMANAQIGRNDCCQNPASSACNIYGYLDDALSRVKHLDHVTGSSVDYNTILTELGKFQPLGIRVAWSGGGAHVICASGHQTGNYVVVDDPFYGPSVVTYNTLKSSYRASGSWTHSYFTKR